jgi:hypothetical protein
MLSTHRIARDPENDDQDVIAYRCHLCLASIKFNRPGGEAPTVTDDGSGDFFAPADVDAAVGACPGPQRIVSKDDFLSRLTDPEVIALMGSWDEQCKVMVARFDHKATVNLDSPILSDFLAYCETIGCLAAGRAAEILA